MLKDKSPHIICLQEVIPEFIQDLVNQEWVREYYMSSDVTGHFVEPYGVCILSKFPIVYSAWSLPTQMGRNLVIGSLKFKSGHSICCATVHLESLNLSNYRAKQLEIISEILKNHDTAILTGDFNFDSDINYSQHLKKCKIAEESNSNPSDIRISLDEPLENDVVQRIFPDYSDVWKVLRPTERGYTFDSEKNTMLTNYEQMRYDRILFKSKDSFLKTVDIKLIGTERIPEIQEETVFPSDHFGLELRLKFTHKN